MATLDALAIRGIRSFDPQKMERINFASPGVTVIVGHNGSGKTTIVECLKYATTGDQPPNTKGGAFVHDPKMAREKEVKAQVKLRFYARNRVRMTATRNLMVTVKKGGQTMKTLESLLDAENPQSSKRSTISTKCAEIDAEIPNLLGVSKAVLENVIFCHQEDSYWPLAEASILKKKFDDIFEATKYTKALENIRAIKKERVAELKVEQERLGTLALEKQRAEKISKRTTELSNEVGQKEIEIAELFAEEDRITNENIKFYDQAMKFKEHYLKAEELEKRNQLDKEDLRGLEEALGKDKLPASVTDSDLEKQQRDFEANTKNRQQELDRIKRATEEQRRNEAQVEKRLKDVQREQGMLEGDARRHESDLIERQEAIGKLSDVYGIVGYDGPSLSALEVDDFISKIKILQKKQNAEAEKIQDTKNSKVADYNAKIADYKAQVAAIERERGGADTQITRLQASIQSAVQAIDKNKTIESDLKFNADNLIDKNLRLENLNNEIAAAGYDAQISALGSKIRQAEGDREALLSEQSRSSLQANDRAKLDVKRGDVQKKKADIDRILETHNQKHLALVGVDAQPKSMEDDVDKLHSSKTRELSRLEIAHTRANQAAADAANAHSRLRDERQTKHNELQTLEPQLAEGLLAHPDSTLQEAIAVAQAEVQYGQEAAGNIAGTGDFYRKLLKDGKEKGSCEVCTRKFTNDSQFKAFEKSLLAFIASTSEEKIAENEEVLRVWNAELDRLRDLLPIEDRIARLKDEISDLDRTIPEHAEKDHKAKEASEKALADLKRVKTVLDELAVLREAARNVSRAQEEMDALRKEIKEIERGLQSSGSLRTAVEIQAEVDQLAQEIKALHRQRDVVSAQKDQHLIAQRTVENEIHSMELKDGKLKNQLQEGQVAAERMVKDEEELAAIRKRIPTFATQITALKQKIADVLAKQKEDERQMNDQLAVAREKCRILDTGFMELEGIQSRIDKYTQEDRASKLQTCIANAASLEQQLQQLSAAVENHRKELAAANKAIDQGGAKTSMLRDNKRLRAITQRIENTNAELATIPMEEAAISKQTFDTKWEKMSRKEKEIKTRSARLTGEVNMVKAQIAASKKDLATDYKNINKRYMEQLVKVKMSDMINNDLEKYAKALDNAIMKYHSLKMEEVNDTMRHLWNKTYQGTDIDGIQIKSEGEGGASKRSYNYRVVMTKDQVEMDMRGRCSAGQKMLASIIIRLALSDSFGQDCGILALDEPTNALDTENIEALASSLVEIIQERKRHANFQLIIITHDENFLRKLGENGVIQDYWRVARNDKQKSIIEKHILA